MFLSFLEYYILMTEQKEHVEYVGPNSWDEKQIDHDEQKLNVLQSSQVWQHIFKFQN